MLLLLFLIVLGMGFISQWSQINRFSWLTHFVFLHENEQIFLVWGEPPLPSVSPSSHGHQRALLGNSDEEFDTSLAQVFAQRQGKTARFIHLSTLQAIQQAMSQDRTALAIGLPLEENPRWHSFSPYRESRLILIGQHNKPGLDDLMEMNTPTGLSTPSSLKPYRLAISAYNPHINNIEQWRREYPQVSLLVRNTANTIELLKTVEDGQADFVLLENKDWEWLVATQPQWQALLSFDVSLPMAWRADINSPQETRLAVAQFFDDIRADGTLLQLVEQFQWDADRFEPLDLSYFDKRRQVRLPGLMKSFETAATQTDLPVNLLIALSYQESQWDETAFSPTGAKGLMMINDETAQFLAMPSTASPETQILMGAKYLRMLIDSLSVIPEPDRTLIALSGYNIGPGALSRILRITAQARDPNSLASSEPSHNSPTEPNSGTQTVNKNTEANINTQGLIRVSFSPETLANITWPRVRHTLLQQAVQGRMSSQPVILTERVRAFKNILDKSTVALPSLSSSLEKVR